MAKATTSRWREHSRTVIASVLATLPADADLSAKRKALREAYPFGPRQYHPYKVWREECRKAVVSVTPRPKASNKPRLVVAGANLWVDVDCPLCERLGRKQVVTRGCMFCGPLLDRLTELLKSSDFLGLLRACRADRNDWGRLLILADWLEDRAWDELGGMFRELAAKR